MRARRGARRGAGLHVAGHARPTPRPRLRAAGRYAARTARSRRRVLSRIGVAALLLPVAVGAGAPAAPAPVQPHTDATLTRALAVTTADSTQPVASVTVLPERRQHLLRPEPVARRGVPAAALRAYVAAEATMRVADPSCRLRWSLLAGIGEVESRHGNGGSDRLGPMQFVPATWQVVGVDADGDDRRDQRDIDDAALAAAAYLCAGPGDLGTRHGALDAVVAYNRSPGYADVVLALSDAYRRHVDELPAVATAALPTGGVTVGVGSAGEGVLVGGSDNVASDSVKKARTARERNGDRPAGDKVAEKDARRADARAPNRPAADARTRERQQPESTRPPRTNGPSRPPTPRPSTKPAHGAGPEPQPSPRPGPRPSTKPTSKPTPKPPETKDTITGTLTVDADGVITVEGVTLTGEGLEIFDGKRVTVTGTKAGGVLTVESIEVTAPA